MNECPYCSGNGLAGGCTGCGKYNFTSMATTQDTKQDDFKIPSYYRVNQWDRSRMKLSQNQYLNAILEVVDKLVQQSKTGKMFASSYCILLPYAHGKKTAMFSIIQNYIQNNRTVAPVVDIASLAIMENNFKANDRKATALWTQLIESDLVCVYGVDFSARYQTMKLFLNLCSIRGLQGKATLLFAENSLDDLKSKYVTDHLSEANNRKDIGCKLSNPIILDGVVRRKLKNELD